MRATKAQKEQLRHAAHKMGLSQSDYALTQLLAKSTEEKWVTDMPTFTEEDFHFLTKEIENPGPPNQLSVEENKWAAKNADFDIKRLD